MFYNLIKSHIKPHIKPYNIFVSYSYSNWFIKSPFYIKNIRNNRINAIKRFLDNTR